MQVKLVLRLGNHGDHAGVVGAWGELREIHILTFDEHLNPKNAQHRIFGVRICGLAARRGRPRGVSRQRIEDFPGSDLGFFEDFRFHRLGLPGFHVIPGGLPVPDRRAKTGANLRRVNRVQVAHAQQGDFVVKSDFALHDDPPGIGTCPGAGLLPSGGQVLGTLHARLAVPRGGHGGLHETGKPDLCGSLLQCRQRVGESKRRSQNVCCRGGQGADALAVKSQFHHSCGRYDSCPFPRGRNQRAGGKFLDFRNNEVRTLRRNHSLERLGIGHVQHAM